MNTIASTCLPGRKLLLVFIAALELTFASVSLHSAIISWDGGAGTGAWGTANNWSNNSAWNSSNTANFDTDIANNQYSITLGANRAVRNITFSSGTANQGFTFNAGNTLTVNNSAGIVNNDNDTQTFATAIALGTSQTWNAASGAMDFSGNISNGTRTLTLTGTGTSNTISGVIGNGSGGIIKTGTSTWTLSGVNTYTGATTINAGTLAATANRALGTIGGATTVNSGGTLGLQGGFNYTTAESVTITGVGASGRAGAIDNISGTNTFAGALTVASDARIGATAGALTLSGAINLSASATADRTLTFNPASSTSITASGKITDALNASFALNVEHIGNGTVTLSNGTNNYWGNTTIGTAGGTTTGTLALGANNALPTVNNASVLTVYSGTLDLNNFNATAFGTLALGGGGASSTAAITTGTGTLTLGGNVSYNATNNPNGATIAGNLSLGANRTFTINDSSAATADLTVSAAISGVGFGLTKAGLGTMVLSGTNNYSGTTTVNAGTLLANGAASLGATTGNVTVSAGTLALAGGAAVTAGSPTNAETISKSGTLSLSGSGATASTGALHAAGSTGQTSQWIGNITLAGNATISAADNLLIIGNGSYTNTLGLGTSTLTFNTTAAASVTPTYLPSPSFTLDPTNILFNSALSGSGGIIKDGTGTVTIISYPSNSYTGATVINDGKLIIGGPNNLPVISSTSVTVGDGTGAADSATLQMGFLASGFAAKNYQIGTASGSSATTSMTIDSDGLFNLNGGNNALVNLTLHGGHVDLGAGYSNLLTLTGGITTTASAQTALIEHGNLGLSANSFTLNVADGAAAADLQIDSIVQNGLGYTGGSSGTFLVKAGAGTLVLTGTNTYDGVTDVQAGVLNIQNNAALGQGTAGTTVQTGAQLQLDGSAGNLTIATESLTLNGNGTSTTGELRNVAGNNTYNGFITLGGDSRINADSGTSLTIASPSGTGATIINGNAAGRTLTAGGAGNIDINSVIGSNIGTFVKDGSGTVTLGGGYAAQTITTVKDGTLALNMGAGGLNAAGATVTIGDGVGAANTATLLLSQSNQIADTTTVALGSDGRFNVNSNTETIGSIAGSGNILLGTGQLIAGGNDADTTFSGTLVGASTSLFQKAGAGTLTIGSDLGFAGDLNLTGGTLAFNVNNAFTNVNISAGTTLRLSDTTLNIASLNLTGSGSITLDFAGVASQLNVTNLNIAAGITLNIINWQDAVDYFFAANWTGAVVDTTGAAPMNQVIFNSPTWSGADTKWQSYDSQITPVPEPSTYGAMLLGAMGALLGYRRWRRAQAAKV